LTYFSKIKHFQGFFKHAVNPEHNSLSLQSMSRTRSRLHE